MPFNLSKRPGHLGKDLKIQPKQVREDMFARFGIPLAGVELTAGEFGQLQLNDKAPKHFWRHHKGRAPEVAYSEMGAITLIRPVRECTVSVWLAARIMKMHNVSLVKSRLVLTGNGALWGFTIQAMPQLNDLVEALIATLGQPILIEIDCPTWGAQQDLPLEEEEEDETADPDEQEAAAAEAETPRLPLGESDDAEGASRIQRDIERSEGKKRTAAAKKAKRGRKA